MFISRVFIVLAVPLVIVACSSVVPNKTTSNQVDIEAQNSLPPNDTGRPQQPPRIDFATAAQKLGVTEAKLKTALKVPEKPPTEPSSSPPPPPDIKGAAVKLGVTEKKLIEALRIPPHPPTENPPTTK
ncbi:MAG: hypothetical protein DSM106950_29525 [Stigonema ocellatum SAG 48.90 = DSM 106950]|nr:hypothetical protein [Stigonema ocellatum SAG 48.90 = DSM 106950]